MRKEMTMGIIVGNRGFFPGLLAKTGRDEMIAAVKNAGINPLVLGPEDSKHGAVETRPEARACADLFRKHAEKLDGIIVTLPNFGDERGVAETLRMANLNVPVLIQATPDAPGQMQMGGRRDSFCGKMSVCNNLKQYGIPYSLTTLHTEAPDSATFRKDLEWFAGVCRVTKGLRNLRIGAIGARPAAFNTVRYSEKVLEANGISIEPIDLSEIFGQAERMKDSDPTAQAKIAAIRAYLPTQGVPDAALLKMAKFGAVVERFMKETECTVTAIQCWTSMETYFGVVPCTIMSMLSDGMMPSACEVDVCGAVAMQALALATEAPSALLDWNNNYGDDPNKAVCFHCSNLPKHFFEEIRMDFQEIIAGSVGKDNTWGTCVGRVKASPMSYARFTTDETTGKVRGYTGDGRFTNDPLTTFGGAGVVEIPRMQDLLHYICENGYEHHVAANLCNKAPVVHEAANRYLGWDVYLHQ